MKTIAIVNKKGGVAKSTTALAMISGLHRRGYKVLAVDVDAQANMSTTLKRNPEEVGAFEVLTEQCLASEAIQNMEECDLISGDGTLVDTESILKSVGREYKLKEALESLQDNYDYCIIDTPPSIGILSQNAMVAADTVIITAQAEPYSADGLMVLAEDIFKIKKYCNPQLTIDGVLVTRFNQRPNVSKKMLEEIQSLAAHMNTKVYNICIRENAAIREAQYIQKSIFDNPKSNGAKDYKKFLDEFLEAEGK